MSRLLTLLKFNWNAIPPHKPNQIAVLKFCITVLKSQLPNKKLTFDILKTIFPNMNCFNANFTT